MKHKESNLNYELTTKEQSNGSMTIEELRAIEEVHGQLVIAQKCPRNINKCMDSIRQTAAIPEVAKSAKYGFPKGDKKDADGNVIKDEKGKPVKNMVRGLSIRAAECLVQSWGNIFYGSKEVFRGEDYSEVAAFAWDLETNLKVAFQNTIRHYRTYKSGTTIRLTSDRDILEKVNLEKAKMLREAVKKVVPIYAQLEFDRVVEETRAKIDKMGSDPKLVKKKILKELKPFGVYQKHIEEFLGHPIEEITPEEFDILRDIKVSLTENIGTWADLTSNADPEDEPEIESQVDEELKKDSGSAEIKSKADNSHSDEKTDKDEEDINSTENKTKGKNVSDTGGQFDEYLDLVFGTCRIDPKYRTGYGIKLSDGSEVYRTNFRSKAAVGKNIIVAVPVGENNLLFLKYLNPEQTAIWKATSINQSFNDMEEAVTFLRGMPAYEIYRDWEAI